jgi:hypothetical protein
VLGAVSECTPKQLIAALDLLLAHENFVLQEADVVAAALTRFRAKPALGFSDCLGSEIASKAAQLQWATFDKALVRLLGAHRLQAIHRPHEDAMAAVNGRSLVRFKSSHQGARLRDTRRLRGSNAVGQRPVAPRYRYT